MPRVSLTSVVWNIRQPPVETSENRGFKKFYPVRRLTFLLVQGALFRFH
jgi:hypothetical protein